MKLPKVDHIYIVCCGKFEDRTKYMRQVMKSLGFDDDYYTLSMDDRELNFSENSFWESLTPQIVNEYYIVDQKERNKELTITEQDAYAPKDISLADISVSINHLLIWKQAMKRKYQNILVLEDDILFFNESIKGLTEILKVLPSDYDFVSLEDGAHMHATMFGHVIHPEKLLYHISSGRMRCTGAYLMSSKACETVCAAHSKKKWTLEIDHVIDLYGKLGLVKVYWAEPCVFTQGSQKGVYRSGVQAKKIKSRTYFNSFSQSEQTC